ncbi:MAG: GNAT family N-acetyltransferase [Cellulosilyticum sp.]|nr:GNAT family N-acetyltransferase [Cellulosilyticum sp.]
MIKEIINHNGFEIKTNRLRIVPVTETEAENYFREFTDEIARYQYPEPFSDLEATKKFIGDFTWAKKEGLHLVCSLFNEENQFIGSIEVYKLGQEWPELGIWICKAYQRQGYAYEAINGVIQFFKVHDVATKGFIYEADRRNPSSLKLVQKLQGVEVGYQEVPSDAGEILELKKYIIGSYEHRTYLRRHIISKICDDVER